MSCMSGKQVQLRRIPSYDVVLSWCPISKISYKINGSFQAWLRTISKSRAKLFKRIRESCLVSKSSTSAISEHMKSTNHHPTLNKLKSSPRRRKFFSGKCKRQFTWSSKSRPSVQRRPRVGLSDVLFRRWLRHLTDVSITIPVMKTTDGVCQKIS